MKQSELHHRLARWTLKLHEFSVIITHGKGSKHLVHILYLADIHQQRWMLQRKARTP